MAKAVVTGGAGFIGSHLVDRLLADGHSVIAADNLACGSDVNLAQARRNPAFRLEVADVADGAAMAPLLKGVDWVFHLAALADIVPSIQQPRPYHRANVDGTIEVLEASRAAGIKRRTGDGAGASLRLSLPSDTVHTLVLLDGAGGLRISDLEDTAGSQVLPRGGAATGLGGTAPRPASSPLPWLGVIAGGGLLAGLGIRRRRPVPLPGARRP